MVTFYSVLYETYPEPGNRVDVEDVFFATHRGEPNQRRSWWEFNNGERRYQEDSVVRINELWSSFDGEPPRELVEEYPIQGWVEWAESSEWSGFPTECADGTPLSDLITPEG